LGRRLDRFPQGFFMEWTLDHTFQKKAHRVTGPVVDEYQLFERRQRASGRGIGRFGGKGVSGRGVHGGFEDTFAIPEPRICRENATEASCTPPAKIIDTRVRASILRNSASGGWAHARRLASPTDGSFFAKAN
jgi:hypothetical protein